MNHLKKLVILVIVSLFGVAVARQVVAVPAEPIDTFSYTALSQAALKVTEVEVRAAVTDSGRSLSAQPGYRLVVFLLQGRTPKDAQVLISSNGFRVVYEQPNREDAGSRKLVARQSGAVAFDEDWIVPGEGEWGTFLRRVPRGAFTLRVAVVVPEGVKSVRLEIRAAVGNAMALPPG